jgi:teichuronic acid exporter
MSQTDLRTRAVKSTAWFLAARLWIQGVSWLVTIVVARLLAPQEYGLFGMALGVMVFLELFHEFGLGTAIIQRREVSRQQLNAIFWMVCSVSFLLVAIVFVSAGLAAAYYAEPRLVWIIRLLALSFLLNALGMLPYNLLTREIDFRRRSLGDVVGVIASAGVCVVLAYLGYGVWALVFGSVTRAAVANAVVAMVCGWVPGFEVSLSGTFEMVKFGLRVTGVNLAGSFTAFTSPMIIGRLLGSSALGLYSMAEGVATGPHRISTSVINQLSFPLFSKLQDDNDSLRTYFLKITKYLAAICFPVQIGMVLTASDLVGTLLSAKWREVVPLLQVLSLAGVFYVLASTAAPLLMARGKPHLILRLAWGYAAVLAVTLLVGARFGLIGAVYAYFLTSVPTRLYSLALSAKELGLTLRQYLASVSSSTIAAAGMVATVAVVRWILPHHGAPVQNLALDATCGVVAYLLVLLSIDQSLRGELKSLAHAALPTISSLDPSYGPGRQSRHRRDASKLNGIRFRLISLLREAKEATKW